MSLPYTVGIGKPCRLTSQDISKKSGLIWVSTFFLHAKILLCPLRYYGYNLIYRPKSEKKTVHCLLPSQREKPLLTEINYANCIGFRQLKRPFLIRLFLENFLRSLWMLTLKIGFSNQDLKSDFSGKKGKKLCILPSQRGDVRGK